MAPKKPQRRRDSLRLKDFDYSSEGCYFVTIACKQKKTWLEGDVAKRIVQKQLTSLEHRFGIVVDCSVIMPDHIHLMIILPKSGEVNLSQVIQALKSLVAKEFRENSGIPQSIWQRGFYDHVIRNEKDYLEKKRYILQNPLKKQLSGQG
jgi:putative transposase